MKQIKFIPDNDEVKKIFGLPKPAKQCIPEWYKKTEKFYQKTDKEHGLHFSDARSTNTTIKSCVPFLDALSMGYIWELPTDLELRKTDDIIQIKWRYGKSNLISTHDKVQFEKMPLPLPSKDPSVFKFQFEYTMVTPKGYSTLFTHPLNNHDLPFRTFSGVVDTDMYEKSVQFPFIIHADFGKHIIIPRGTPIVQFIPFKRDKWEHVSEEFDKDKFEKANHKFFSKIQNSYKTQFWQKKSFS
jgi:hypothetical protein